MSFILIKNGTVVNDDCMFKADVLIKNQKIVEVGNSLICNDKNCEVLDATERYVIPGGIDPHTHMQMPFMGEVSVDDFFYGTKAALAGGTTMIIDFVMSDKNLYPIKAYKQWRQWADLKVCCDYSLSVAITCWNDEVSAEMATLVKHEYGINSFKFFLAYKNILMLEDHEFFQGLKQCAKLKALARVHAENGPIIAEKQQELLKLGITGPEGHAQSRPEELEAEATNRACVLSAQANCPLYVVHVMSAGAAKAITTHRQRGEIIFGESIAAGLALDGSHYYNKDWQHAANYVLSPPLSRHATTPEILMNLLTNSQLHLTASDNCTFSCAQKRVGLNDFTKIPNGVNGVEDRLSIVWDRGVASGKIDPMRFVSITSTTAAKIFNIYPQKGRIQVGSDADIVIWNPNEKRTISAQTHHHAVDFNIFEGLEVIGVADVTISRGQVVWSNKQFTKNLTPGFGKFIPLYADCDHVFGAKRIIQKDRQPRKVKRNNLI